MTILQAVVEPQSFTPVQRRELPMGCFCSTELSDLRLPLDFYRLGAHACDNYKLLSHVDVETTIAEIREFTFVHCVQLQDVMLPYTAGGSIFFPRVRTPCGHGAQVIIEGREIQSDGGEEDKDNPTNNKKPKPTTTQRPSLHHPVVFPLY